MARDLWIPELAILHNSYSTPVQNSCCMKTTDLQRRAGYTLGFAVHFSSFILIKVGSLLDGQKQAQLSQSLKLLFWGASYVAKPDI